MTSKRFLISTLCICLAWLGLGITATAQETDSLQVKKGNVKDYFDEGKPKFIDHFFVGGGIRQPSLGQVLSLGFDAHAGYRITDHFHAALGGSFQYVTDKNIQIRYSSVSAFARYLLINFEGMANNYGDDEGSPMSGIYIKGEFARQFVSADYYAVDGDTPDKYSFNQPLLGLGYSSNYYKGFGTQIEVLYDFNYEESQIIQQWPIVYRIGLYYAF